MRLYHGFRLLRLRLRVDVDETISAKINLQFHLCNAGRKRKGAFVSASICRLRIRQTDNNLKLCRGYSLRDTSARLYHLKICQCSIISKAHHDD